MEKNGKQRIGGFILSYVSIIVSSVVGILFTPYMISRLGKIEYGLYQLLYSVIGYIALLDFGLGGTLTRYILKYKAENNKNKENTVISMCIKLYCIFGVITVIIVSVIALFLDFIFPKNITAENLQYARQLFFLMGLSSAISFLSHALSGIQTAYEKHVITKGVYIARQLLRVVLIMVLLHFNSGAISVVVADLSVTVLMLLFDFCYCKINLRVSLLKGKWDKSLFREVFTFSIFVFIQIFITQTNNGLDRVLLGYFSTLEIIALYGVVMQLYSLFTSIGGVVSGITLPQISNLVFSGVEGGELTDACARYSRYQLHILAPILGGFLLFGRQFATLWVPEYDATAVWGITLLIVVPQIFESVEGSIFNVMKAKNLQKTRSLLLLGVMVGNVMLSIFLIQWFPIYGAAIGTCISFVIGNTILSNIYYHKKVGINIIRYSKRLFEGIALTFIISIVFGIAISFIKGAGIWYFLLRCCLYVVVYLVVLMIVGLNKEEKTILKRAICALKAKHK